MAEATVNITDANLIEQLKNSYIAPDQKTELKPLIPSMNEAERGELMSLIEESINEFNKADPAYQEKLTALNKEYNEKLDKLVKEQTGTAFKEFEKEDEAEDAVEEKELETEMATMPANAKKAETKSAPKKKTHGLRKLILIILVIILIAGGALMGLSYL